jgi:hypothetical protein
LSIEVRGTERVAVKGVMRDLPPPWGTGDLPGPVVNQRVMVTTWVSSRPDRTARWGVGVWMDAEQADDADAFTIGPDGFRGMDGVGLTPSEARYVASCLYQAARRLMGAAGIDV